MAVRLIIDGNAVYEIDEECEACSRGRKTKTGKASTAQEEREESGGFWGRGHSKGE